MLHTESTQNTNKPTEKQQQLVENDDKHHHVAWVEFLENTSLSALPWIKASGSPIRRFFWVLVFGLAMAGLGYHMSIIVTTYYAYPVQVTIGLDAMDMLDFPAVTVCNLNPVKQSKLQCTIFKHLLTIQNSPSLDASTVASGRNVDLTTYNYGYSYSDCDPFEEWGQIEGQFVDKLQREAMLRTMEKLLNVTLEFNTTTSSSTAYITNPTPELVTTSTLTTTQLTDTTAESTDGITVDGSTASILEYNDYYGDEPSGSDSWDFTSFGCICDPCVVDCYIPYWNCPFHRSYNGSSCHSSYINSFDIFNIGSEGWRTFLNASTLADLLDVRDAVRMDENMLHYLGEQIDTFLVECTFDRHTCTMKDFARFTNARYGNCFTFNSPTSLNGRNAISTRNYGSDFGLKLTLNINQAEYVGLFSSEYGVKIQVHSRHEKPFPEADGFTAPPKTATGAAVRWRQLTRLPAPFYSNCTNTFSPRLKSFAMARFNYSVQACREACFNQLLYEQCDCVDFVSDIASSYRLCDANEKLDRECRKSVALHVVDHGFSCQCLPACNETTYSVVTSQAVWPTIEYTKLKVNNFYGQQNVTTMFFQNFYNDEDPGHSLVRVNVYYHDLSIELILENEAYPLSQLMADMGGVMGLYLGMSLCTIVEMMQLIATLLTIPCRAANRRRALMVHHDQVYAVSLRSTGDTFKPPTVAYIY